MLAVLGLLSPSVADGQQLPAVLTNVATAIGLSAVRPRAIAVSADGNGGLSDLQWTKWDESVALATGVQHNRICWETCDKWKEVRVHVELSAPIFADHKLLFSKLTVRYPGHASTYTVASAKWWAATTPTLPPATLAGAWWYVGHSSGGHIVDVVRLDLIDFPAGTLHGTWTETVAPGYQSIGLNGTECLGCGGPPGTYWNSFSVAGSGGPKSFSIQVSNNSSPQFTGGLGTLPAGAAKWYGCTPLAGALMPEGYTRGNSADLFLVDGSNLVVFYRPAAYRGATIGVGAKATCY